MPRPRGTPSYRLHRATGQAVVTIDGKDYYLGAHETADSKRKYDRLIAEWLLRGRQGPAATLPTATISQLIAGYLDYRDQEGCIGESQQRTIRDAMRWLDRFYGDTKSHEFTPMQFKALRDQMIRSHCRNLGKERGVTLARSYINMLMREVRAAIRWAAEVGMLPPTVWMAISAVKSLEPGKSKARETERVRPVDEADFMATMEVAPPQAKAMLTVQRLTGMRIGEVFQLRAIDIDMKGRVWMYRPQKHKTSRYNIERVIPIGPKAQEILRPYLKRDLTAYLFSPADGWHERTRIHILKNGTPRVTTFKYRCAGGPKKFLPLYTVNAFATTVRRIVAKAEKLAHLRNPDVPADVRIVKRWRTHQLRHLVATEMRAAHGIEVAQALLGHGDRRTTEIYAEKDLRGAISAIGEVG